MNNVFPNYIEGETIGLLVAERLRQPERAIAKDLCIAWESLTIGAGKACSRRSKLLVDTYLSHFRECLEVSFIQQIEPEALSVHLQDWSEEIRANLEESFENFSQCELEDFTRDPGLEVMEKGRAVALNSAQEIAKVGAEILTDILFCKGRTPKLEMKSTSVAENIAIHELAGYADSLVAGTFKRMQIACEKMPHVPGYRFILYRLTKVEVVMGLHARLVEVCGSKLKDKYEEGLLQDELITLHLFRSRHIYKALQKEIYRPLQLKAVEHITIQELG